MTLLNSRAVFILLMLAGMHCATAAPGSIAVATFTDDEQSQSMALNNENFSSTGAAGPRVTSAVTMALSAAGVTLAAPDRADAVLHGSVTAAWVNPGMLPTNSVSAHYRLVDRASGATLKEGNATGGGFNNADAAAELGKQIARKIAR